MWARIVQIDRAAEESAQPSTHQKHWIELSLRTWPWPPTMTTFLDILGASWEVEGGRGDQRGGGFSLFYLAGFPDIPHCRSGVIMTSITTVAPAW